MTCPDDGTADDPPDAPPPAPPDIIDMMTFARFAVLPGAARLLSAYAQIPAGKLREAQITAIEAVAEQYAQAPIPYHAEDPLALAAQQAQAPAAPPLEPPLEAPLSGHSALRAVDLRAKGMTNKEVAAELGCSVGQVQMWVREARLHGVKFPHRKTAAEPEAPPEAPPEPAQWPIPYAEQDWQAQQMTRFMAKNAFLTIAEQQAREADVVARLKAGEYPVQIAAALGLKEHIVNTIRSRALKGGVRLPPLARGWGALKAMGRKPPAGGRPRKSDTSSLQPTE